MHFLDKRIGVICDELQRLSVVQRVPIDQWQHQEGTFFTPQQARETDAFVPFDSRRDRWYGPDAHHWFRAEVSVPDSFQGKPLWLSVTTQIDHWDHAQNPQFLLFVDDVPVQGLDRYHQEVRLDPSAVAGRVLRLDLQAYTGTMHREFSLLADLREVDPEIEGLYYDLSVPLAAFARLDPRDRARIELERVLNDAVNVLDLRDPESHAFRDSLGQARALLARELYEGLGGRDEVIATCIGHTHIDVAWLWTVEQTREKVARSFATVLKLMDEYPSYRFMSSQPQLYVFLKERYPELYARVREQVRAGRWEAEGGMWVEADCNLTSGESLVRQFLYGKRFFWEEFGVENRILWLPDVFGYSGALPQIMKQCGIEYFMTTKLAWNQFNKIPHDTFLWRGIDGTEILTHLITTQGVGQDEKNFFTTYNGMLHPDALIAAWRRYQDQAINHDVLVAYGYGDGGGGPTREMLEHSARLEKGIAGIPKVRQAFAGVYFDELSRRVSGHARLPVWEGELYFEYHRGTYTSMGRNKRANRRAEFRLMDLELLSVLARDRVPYPTEALEALWKGILLNQFHDILPGSSIAEVYEVTRREYEEFDRRSAELLAERQAALCPPGGQVTVWNTKGFESGEAVHLGNMACAALTDGAGNRYPVQQTAQGAIAFLRGLPPKGYAVFSPSEEGAAPAVPWVLDAPRRTLETPYYIVCFDGDGWMTRLYDKEHRREVLRAGQRGNLLRMYEDKPMYYDSWDIDMYYTEKYWDADTQEQMEWTELGPVRATLEIRRRISRSIIRQTLHFYADSRRIDFVTRVHWQEHQHLLKVLFPVDVHTDEATFEIQFGNLTRKTHRNTSWDVARFESCGQKWMDVSEGHYGVSLLNDCKYGHSVRDGCIALTLIKSGIDPNPMADQEEHLFTYALFPHGETWRSAGTVREAYTLNQPARACPGGVAGGRFSLVWCDAPNVVIETVKQAEDGRGIIVRLYEAENARTPVRLCWHRSLSRVEEVNLIEEGRGEIPTQGSTADFVIMPYEVKTLRVFEA